MLCSFISILKHRPYHYTERKIIKRFCMKARSNKVYEVNTQKNHVPTLGQPVPSTHPHLLSTGELLPGLKVIEFLSRRRNFMHLIAKDVMKTYGKSMYVVAIIPSATKMFMTPGIPYVFRQNPDFLYLSGCLEPDTILILNGNNAEDFTSTLLIRPSNAQSLLWDGPRTGAEDAVHLFCVNEAFTTDELPEYLNRIADKYPQYLVFYDLQSCSSLPSHNTIINHIQKRGVTICRTGTNFLHQLRVIKSPAEQDLMRKAGQVSSEAINRAIEVTQPGFSEHQLFATVDYESRMRGAETLAYVPVVATGTNANIIHYIDNKQILNDGELVLMDAGCEYHGYCGDITRTWPVNGKFSKYQRILYEIVLELQSKLILLCQERLPLDDLHKQMVHLIGLYLTNEKIFTQDIISLQERTGFAYELCPHHSSHYLGMDVHDVKTIPKNIPLQTGMIITVEPGLYVREENEKVKPEFRNIGIRIEDDILITDTGYEVLSAKCVKTVNDIESLMTK